ncbi:MAG: hypothetical protein HOI56_02000 [Gammaproteobacteria bacterium]|jgi:uncharacterized RmlC-like cupin family protein|nr:hypothetical protein [Gammaproteobacteria bacterium]MBT4462043.1 hypothetical protein [Gammaproteobacteria bacterium]MBT5761496.1 hypothetical protein [Gammaproteobacteria bacterium]|tara:strand:- start:1204 stop:2334 length:1131 start_codon:yes stop_codon:yes gene_type:complete
MKSFIKQHNFFSGLRLRQILNDLKRRPEDAAKELQISISQFNKLLNGTSILTEKLVREITSIWPIKLVDLINPFYDTESSYKIMKASSSKKSSRIMKRGGVDYYEYQDTVMSKNAPFRPEWIRELVYVADNDPNNQNIYWNQGHLLHQFTYFVGEVNFYYLDHNNNKKVAIMNTGDSMFIGYYVPHTFATRNKKLNSYIIAITYYDVISYDIQNELLDYGFEKSIKLIKNSKKNITGKVKVAKYDKYKFKYKQYKNNSIYRYKCLASTPLVKTSESIELEVICDNQFSRHSSSHQYIYILSKDGYLNIEGKTHKVKYGDTIYIKPFVVHEFNKTGLKVLIMSVQGKISEDIIKQLMNMGKKNIGKIIYDDTSWFKK